MRSCVVDILNIIFLNTINISTVVLAVRYDTISCEADCHVGLKNQRDMISIMIKILVLKE